MKLWKISQTTNLEQYRTYDSAVVAAINEEGARKINPDINSEFYNSWVSYKYVNVELLGEALPNFVEGDVICASFNAD